MNGIALSFPAGIALDGKDGLFVEDSMPESARLIHLLLVMDSDPAAARLMRIALTPPFAP